MEFAVSVRALDTGRREKEEKKNTAFLWLLEPLPLRTSRRRLTP